MATDADPDEAASAEEQPEPAPSALERPSGLLVARRVRVLDGGPVLRDHVKHLT